MILPAILQQIEEDTAIVGDIEKFINYVDSGDAEYDWHLWRKKRLEIFDDDSFWRDTSNYSV